MENSTTIAQSDCSNDLSTGVELGDYIIERVLARGGFSTVYLARKKSDQQQVAIKEYRPKFALRLADGQLTARIKKDLLAFNKGRTHFLEEAKLLTTIKHPNIVAVFDFFMAHNTAYIVMNYDYGTTLGKWMRLNGQSDDTDFILNIFQPVMRCIKNMHHRGLLHLDLKPDNILLRPGNNPLILDFGSTLPYKTNQQLKAHSFTKAFAAPELVDKTHALGPWSDVYSIGLTMKALIEKKNQRQNAFSSLSQHSSAKSQLHKAIDWATQNDAKKRPQTIDEFLNVTHYL